jgi:hypothetical protein
MSDWVDYIVADHFFQLLLYFIFECKWNVRRLLKYWLHTFFKSNADLERINRGFVVGLKHVTIFVLQGFQKYLYLWILAANFIDFVKHAHKIIAPI